MADAVGLILKYPSKSLKHPVKSFLIQNGLKGLHGGFCRSVDLDDGIAFVGEHGDLMV